ncbi:MAG: YibE/F family protein [Patescibacteria group bacterium]|nr:YibE/F family protein [Patescibacteria group bacterium]
MRRLGKRILFSLIALAALWLPLNFAFAQTTSTSPILGVQNAQRSQYGTYEKAFVKEAEEQTVNTPQGAQHVFAYTLEFRSGNLENTTQKILVNPESLPTNLKPQVGDLLVVYVQPDINQQAPAIFFESYDRQNAFLWLFIGLVILSLALAGWKSLKIPLIYLLSLLLCFEIAVPLSGWNWSSWLIALILLALFALFGSFVLAKREQRWTVVGGMAVSGMVAYGILNLLASWTRLNLNDDLNLIGSWLVVVCLQLDLALALAYGLSEIKKMTGVLSFKELFQTGMAAGREKLISLAPILSLAFLGMSLALLANDALAGNPWLKFINTETMAEALTLPMAGLISLILSVPLISLIVALANARQVSRGVDPMRRAISWRQEEMTTGTADQTQSVE